MPKYMFMCVCVVLLTVNKCTQCPQVSFRDSNKLLLPNISTSTCWEFTKKRSSVCPCQCVSACVRRRTLIRLVWAWFHVCDVCTLCGGSDQMLGLCTVRTLECPAHHWWYEMAPEERRTNPTPLLLFVIKHTLRLVWVLTQWINVNGFSEAVYHRSKGQIRPKKELRGGADRDVLWLTSLL